MIVYKITNNINGKVYIGQTVKPLNQRWSNHKGISKKINIKHPLYNAMKKYGIDNFKIEEIDGANNITELNYKEWLLIHKNNTLWPNGYNLTNGGGNKGKWCELKRKEHSITMKNRVFQTWNKGIKGICKKNKGSFTSESQIGSKNSFYGKRHTNKTKEKLSKGMDKNKRAVICTTTGDIFDSVKQTSIQMNLDLGNLWKVLNNKQKTIKGYNFKYLDKKGEK